MLATEIPAATEIRLRFDLACSLPLKMQTLAKRTAADNVYG